MAGAWGHGDRCESLYLQREKGNVHVLISIMQWRNFFGTYYCDHPSCGVRVLSPAQVSSCSPM
jgi:hypothetical protein